MELHKNVPKPQHVGTLIELVRDKTLDALTIVAPTNRDFLLNLKSNGDFRKQFREAVEGAATDFAANHEDAALAQAITTSQAFWGSPELEQALSQIATRPLVYIGVDPSTNLADDASLRVIRKLFGSTLPHLATTDPERIEQGVQAFVRFLALRVMSIPALSGVYANYIAVRQSKVEADRFEQLTQILRQHYEALIFIAEKLGPLANLESLLTKLQSTAITTTTATASVAQNNTGAIVTGTVLNSAEPEPQTEGAVMTEAQINELVKKLLACSYTKTASGRAQLIGQLPGDIQDKIKELVVTTPVSHMRNILDTCLEAKEGFASLFEIVKFHDGGTIAFGELEKYLRTLTDPRLR